MISTSEMCVRLVAQQLFVTPRHALRVSIFHKYRIFSPTKILFVMFLLYITCMALLNKTCHQPNSDFWYAKNLIYGNVRSKNWAQTNHVILRFCYNHMSMSLTIRKISFSDHNILVKKGLNFSIFAYFLQILHKTY